MLALKFCVKWLWSWNGRSGLELFIILLVAGDVWSRKVDGLEGKGIGLLIISKRGNIVIN